MADSLSLLKAIATCYLRIITSATFNLRLLREACELLFTELDEWTAR